MQRGVSTFHPPPLPPPPVLACHGDGAGKATDVFVKIKFRAFYGSGHFSRIGSGQVGSGRVGSGRVGSGRVGSGQAVSKYHWSDWVTLTRSEPGEDQGYGTTRVSFSFHGFFCSGSGCLARVTLLFLTAAGFRDVLTFGMMFFV